MNRRGIRHIMSRYLLEPRGMSGGAGEGRTGGRVSPVERGGFGVSTGRSQLRARGRGGDRPEQTNPGASERRGPERRGAIPSPRRRLASAHPTNTPPVNPGKASNPNSSGGTPLVGIDFPAYAVTCDPAPWPDPTTRSARLSPSRSLTASRTPPRLAGSPAKKFANCTGLALPDCTRSLPESASTRGPPPGPPPRITSANPSPSMSPTATNTPLRSVGSNAKKSPNSADGLPAVTDLPSNPATRGPPPNPAPTTRS